MAESSCASEGTVDVLIEPQLPHFLLAVSGESPAAATLRELAAAIGWGVTSDLGAERTRSSWRRWDAETRSCSSRRSRRRPATSASSRARSVPRSSSRVLRERGLDEETIARVRSPAGLDLGPLEQSEIAVAVLAEIVAWRHTVVSSHPLPVEAIDPVCGMTVAVVADTPSAEHDDVAYWFCCPGCRGRFVREPERFLAADSA